MNRTTKRNTTIIHNRFIWVAIEPTQLILALKPYGHHFLSRLKIWEKKNCRKIFRKMFESFGDSHDLFLLDPEGEKYVIARYNGETANYLLDEDNYSISYKLFTEGQVLFDMIIPLEGRKPRKSNMVQPHA